MLHTRRSALLMLSFATVCVFASPALSQAYPSQTIRFVVPAGAGGLPDTVARILGKRLSEKVGQNVVVENRAGGNGAVSVGVLMSSPPDGHTFIVQDGSIYAINPHIYGKMAYSVDDLTPVVMIAAAPLFLAAHAKIPVKSMKEFIDYAKANPGKLAFATSGAGSSNHLLGVRLQQVIGAEMVHVPYRGAGPAMVDTISGNVPSMFDSLPSAAPHIKAGKVRALAVSSDARNPAFPDVPTMKEQGYPDLISFSWFGISVPARTPAPIVDRLAREMQAVLKEPAVVKRWEELGAESSTMSPAEVTRFVQAEIDKWVPVVKASGAKPD